MGLINRDYMSESVDYRVKRYKKQKLKEKRTKKLWQLYAKNEKTFFDKLQIRLIELQNRDS